MKYVFKGFSSEYKGVFTKLDLMCESCGNEWDTNTITSLSTGVGCPRCAAISTGVRFRKDDATLISSFRASGKFTDDVMFWKSHRESNGKGCKHWHSTCPVCSSDKYVEAGLCSGVFESAAVSLQKGAKPCRCSPTYKWTKEQREFQINEKLKELGSDATFVSWVEYTGFDSNIIFHCPTHGEWMGRLEHAAVYGCRLSRLC